MLMRPSLTDYKGHLTIFNTINVLLFNDFCIFNDVTESSRGAITESKFH